MTAARVTSMPPNKRAAESNLLIQKLSGVFLNVALVQVGGQTHQAHFGQAKVCELDVAHGGDEQAVG